MFARFQRRASVRPWLFGAGSALAVLALTGVAAAAMGGLHGVNRVFGFSRVGDVVNGRVLLPDNQWISPFGKRFSILDHTALGSALSPDGTKIAVSESGAVLGILDAATGNSVQQVAVGGDGSEGADPPVYSPDGASLWVPQSADLIRFAVAADGTVTKTATIALTGGLPSGMAFSADQTKLYVALNGKNTLGVIDTATNALTKQIPVGNAPRGVVVVGNQAFVANEGGRPAVAGDTTNASYGTPIVSDPSTGAATTGTVSVVDLGQELESTTIKVGLEPTVEYLNGGTLFVANSNNDSVSIIDTRTRKVTQTFNVNPLPGTTIGSDPNGITMPDPQHVLVSIGRDNAVAVYKYNGPAYPISYQGLIPTDSYPIDVQYDAPLGRVVVTNVKGIGARGTPNSSTTGGGGALGRNTYNYTGSITTFAMPDNQVLGDLTESVFENNDWKKLVKQADGFRKSRKPSAIPEMLGGKSPIKHVFLIIKENRTYDQVLGDIGKGESSAALTSYGQAITPNQHALANQFTLFDNFFDEGTLSADGHNWLMQADANDYLEKQFGAFVRSYPFDGGDPLAYQPDGFLWNAAQRAGNTVRNYGEYESHINLPSPTPSWNDWWHDSLVMEGKIPGPLRISSSKSYSDVPSLNDISNPAFPMFDTDIPDQYRADIWEKDFDAALDSGKLPNLTLMSLPADHTGGGPGPVEQVADNDLAVGRIVSDISNSKVWKNSAVFVLEDDTQAGTDHIDGHRGPLYIASPYVDHDAINSEYFTQLNVVKTIEQILGIQPMNQEDRAAEPMWSAFSDTPDLTPFNAVDVPAAQPPAPPAPVSAAACSSQAPSAAQTTATPPWTTIAGNSALDVVAGDTYYAVKNGCVQGDIVTRAAANGGQGTLGAGWLADFGVTDSLHQEEFDWSELDLTTKDYLHPINTSSIWGLTAATLPLPNISIENGSTVVASGTGKQQNGDTTNKIQATMRTTAVAGAPALKLAVTLHNTDTSDYHGFLHYQLDPDTSNDVAYVPGVSGGNPDFVFSGWTSNYLFHDNDSSIANPADGLVWDASQPIEALEGQNLNGITYGIWFNADVPAGGDKTITWYQVQDYPGQFDKQANIVKWANVLVGGAKAASASAARAKPTGVRSLSASSLATTGAPQKYGKIAAAWVAWTHKQRLGGRHPAVDLVNSAQLNRLDWYLTKGWTKPYPGDKKILAPELVPGHDLPLGYLGEG
ncbi:MAG TPA: bifunctional YncE family protein/alkaline phosphatase family protein [Solirubrobacter sp.]